MSESKNRYSGEFKREAVRRMADCKTVVGLAAELGIRRKFLYLWREQLAAGGEAALERGRGRPPGKRAATRPAPVKTAPEREEKAQAREAQAEQRIAELERLLGQKQLEIDFFKRTFEQVRGAAASPTGDGATASIGGSKLRSHSKGKV